MFRVASSSVLFVFLALGNVCVVANEFRSIDDFKLHDLVGAEHRLSDYRESELVVVYFTGTECPLAKLYGPRMQKIADRYKDQVAVLGVSSNVQDSIADVSGFVEAHGIQFPVLHDAKQQVADLFQARRTPEVFVLDQERNVRYHGRVDGQFTFWVRCGIGSTRGQTQRSYRSN